MEKNDILEILMKKKKSLQQQAERISDKIRITNDKLMLIALGDIYAQIKVIDEIIEEIDCE